MCEEIPVVFRAFKKYCQDRTAFEIIASLFCWLFLIFGSAGRLVFLDKFRRYTLADASPFALEWISDLFVFVFFALAFLIYVIVKRPDLRYLRHKRGIVCMIIAGFGLASAFYLQGYATAHVDPALKHISALVLVVVTSAIAYFAETGPGRGAVGWMHLPVFLFCIGGVLLAGAGSLKHLPETIDTNDERAWFSIFILAFVPQAIALITVTYYFKRYLIFREQDFSRASANSGGIFVSIDTNNRSSLNPAEDDNDDRYDYRAQKRTDPLTGKIVFAFWMTLVQLIATMLLAPTDVAPFFGSSSDAQAGLDHFRDSFKCVFSPSTFSNSNNSTVVVSNRCDEAWRPFLELTFSSIGQVIGLMFALQRTPFGTAQAIVLGVAPLAQLLRSSFPRELDDRGAKVGTTPSGEALGAVALSLASVLLTFVAEEMVRLEGVARRSAQDGGDSSPSGGRGGGAERQPLVNADSLYMSY